MKKSCSSKKSVFFIIFVLIFFSVGCVEINQEVEPFVLSDFNGIRIEFLVNAVVEQLLINDTIPNLIQRDTWGHVFLSYSTVEINGSIDDEWNEHIYTASWDYNYWYDTTRKQGNMTVVFSADASSVVSLHATETLTDEHGKTWTFTFEANDIRLYEPVSTDAFKMYSVLKINACSQIIDIDYIGITPVSHPSPSPGIEQIIDYDCDEYSVLIVSVVKDT